MAAVSLLVTAVVLGPLSVVYLWLLNKSINGNTLERDCSGPDRASGNLPNDEEIVDQAEGWDTIDVLKGTPAESATGKRYLITGGSGSVGREVVTLLLQRGESHIYVLDLSPLPPSLQKNDKVILLKADLADAAAVKAVFEEARPDVVYHIGSIIRPSERWSFTHKYSYGPNVDGTANVLDGLSNVEGSEKILVYCSTAGIEAPNLNMGCLYWKNTGPGSPFFKTRSISDEHPLAKEYWQDHLAYQRTKRLADTMVLQYNGRNELRTGILRPGMALMGPRDLFFSEHLRNPAKVCPWFGMHYISNHMDCRDLAACHLMYETALRERPNEVGGEAFLLTGDRSAWTYAEWFHAIEVLGGRITVRAVPALALYCLSHVVETFVGVRFYALLAFNRFVKSGKEDPRLYPDFIIADDLHRLQPGIWDIRLSDAFIDDTRVRKVLGYRNKFNNAQTTKWIIESTQNEKAGTGAKAEAVPAVPVMGA